MIVTVPSTCIFKQFGEHSPGSAAYTYFDKIAYFQEVDNHSAVASAQLDGKTTVDSDNASIENGKDEAGDIGTAIANLSVGWHPLSIFMRRPVTERVHSHFRPLIPGWRST